MIFIAGKSLRSLEVERLDSGLLVPIGRCNRRVRRLHTICASGRSGVMRVERALLLARNSRSGRRTLDAEGCVAALEVEALVVDAAEGKEMDEDENRLGKDCEGRIVSLGQAHMVSGVPAHWEDRRQRKVADYGRGKVSRQVHHKRSFHRRSR